MNHPTPGRRAAPPRRPMEAAATVAVGVLWHTVPEAVRASWRCLEARDLGTARHSARVAAVATLLGLELGLAHEEVVVLYQMAILHDVGKIAVEDSILKNPGRLSSEQYARVQDHVRESVEILADLGLGRLLPGVADHHERPDGGGYPVGRCAADLAPAARILAVADAYDAMMSRDFRGARTSAEVDQALREGVGTQWDPEIVAALLARREAVELVRRLGDDLAARLPRRARETNRSEADPCWTA